LQTHFFRDNSSRLPANLTLHFHSSVLLVETTQFSLNTS
jgi:hypothetical protein